MDLAGPSDLLRRWIPLAAVGAALVAAPTYIIAGRQAPVYEATAVLLPEQLLPAANPDYNATSVARLVGLSTTWSVIAETATVLQPVAQSLGLAPDTVALAKLVNVAVDTNTGALQVTGRGSSAEAATALANAVASAVSAQSSEEPANPAGLVTDLDRVRSQMLVAQDEYQALLLAPGTRTPVEEAQLAAKLALLDELRDVYSSLAESLQTKPDGLVLVDGASSEAARQTAPRTAYYTALAVTAMLLLTLGLAALLTYMDDRLRDPEGVRRVTGLTTLGSVGKRRRFLLRREAALPTLTKPASQQAEAYRSLRASLALGTDLVPIKTLLIVGTRDASGSARTAANLAIVYAQAGDRVLLVDADLRKPRLDRLFSVPRQDGLTTLVRDPSVSLLRASTGVPGVERLRLLPSGELPLDPAQLVGSPMLLTQLDRFAADHDVVIVTAPPLDAAIDGAVIASVVGQTVIVVNSERDREKSVLSAAEQLLRANARMLGAVLYRAPRSLFSRYGGHAQSPDEDSLGAYDARSNPAPGSVDSR